MKPTYGTVSRYGLVAFASSLDQIGPLTTTVADSAVLFDVIGGQDPLDSTCLERPVPRTGLGARRRRGGAAGGVGHRAGRRRRRRPWRPGCTRPPRCWRAAGAQVEDCSIPELRHGLPAYYVVAPAEASSNLSRYDGVRYGLRVDADTAEAMNAATRAAGFGPEVKRRIMLGTYALSAGYYDAYYGQAQKVRTLIIDALAAAYQRFDVLLGATTPTTAFALGAKVDDPWAMYLSDVCTVPVEPGRASRHQRPLRQPTTADCPSACRCSPRRWASRSCSRWRPWSSSGAPVLAPPRVRAAMSPDAAGPGEGGGHPTRAAWEPVIGLEVHCELQHRDQALLRVPQRLRRRAQHQHLPRVPGPARLAAGAQRAGRGVRHADRPGPALRDPAVDLPPQELLLSRHAQGLSGQSVRRAHQRRTAGSSCPTGAGWGSSGPTWKRTPARPRTSAAAVGSTTPTTPSSTTTAPACRWWRSSPRPTSGPPTQARLYASELRGILVATGASDGRMEEGSMRVDANVSVRPAGTVELGTRCEIKNLNSLRSLGRAIEYEIERQIGLLEAGDKVVQQTRHWNEDQGVTVALRSKEEAFDYRYFPEPDLVPVVPDAGWQSEVAASIGPMPAERRGKLAALFGPEPVTRGARRPDRHRGRARPRRARDRCRRRGGRRRRWRWRARPTRRRPIPTRRAASTCRPSSALLRMEQDGKLSATQAKAVLADMLEHGGDPAEIARRRGFEALDSRFAATASWPRSSPRIPTSGSGTRPATTSSSASSPARSWRPPTAGPTARQSPRSSAAFGA